MRSALRRALRHLDYGITTAGDGREALAILDRHPAGTFAVAIVDLCMPHMNGLDVLTEIKRRSPDTQVLILTGQGTIGDAVRAMRLGADDFLEKPFDPDALRERVRTAHRIWCAKRSPVACSRSSGFTDAFQGLIGESEQMQHIRCMARQVADSEATLLIQGESGTGKEQLAKAIHFGGNRAGNPFVPIDMSSISVTVIESELFGHTKGAFTSASRDREGLLRAAGKGTVFLDEIGELPLNMQTRLLRVLQEREVRPVGSEKMLPIEARLIVATNKDLASAVKRKEFREDLYHRLNVVELTMPPLRERTEDISLLAQHFLLKYRDERPTVEGIADEALALLSEYNWPGNVRELENAILRAVVVGTSELIGISDLPLHVTRSSTGATGLGPRRSAQAEACGSNAASADSLPATDTLASYEREAIITALEKSGGNRERAAKLLDIGVATLYRKLKRYHIT